MGTMSDLATNTEDRIRLLLVQVVMERIRCSLVTDETGLITCQRHCASVENWGLLGERSPANVCLHAVTQAGLSGGQ